MKSGQRKLLLISLFSVFILSIFVRSSIVFDLLGRWLGIDLFMRLITRLPWLFSMVVLVVVVAIVGVMSARYGKSVWLAKKSKEGKEEFSFIIFINIYIYIAPVSCRS
jgi:choline-glycine betaine transporter